jgi:hypothetical protein
MITPCDPALTTIASENATYFSPKIAEPASSLGGTWMVNYKGAAYAVAVPDPTPSAELTIPLPSVVVSNDILNSVTWTFSAPNGTPLAGPPAYLTGIHVQALNGSGAVIFDSGSLSSSQLAYSLTQALHWSDVNTLRFLYFIKGGNSYVVGFPNVAVAPILLSAVGLSTASGFALELSGAAGHRYLLQISADLTHWTNLLTTNLTSTNVTFPDATAVNVRTRFYRAQFTN